MKKQKSIRDSKTKELQASIARVYQLSGHDPLEKLVLDPCACGRYHVGVDTWQQLERVMAYHALAGSGLCSTGEGEVV